MFSCGFKTQIQQSIADLLDILRKRLPRNGLPFRASKILVHHGCPFAILLCLTLNEDG